jgi:hypothetical protein
MGAGPLSLSMFVTLDSGAVNQTLFTGLNAAQTAFQFKFQIIGATNNLRFEITSSGTNMNLQDSGFTSGVRRHIYATWSGTIGTATTEMELFVDGVSQSDATQDGTGTANDGQSIITVGELPNDTMPAPGVYEELAIWTHQLTNGQPIAQGLSNGYSPLRLGARLVAYCPLVRSATDIKRGVNPSTDQGTVVPHGAIIPWGEGPCFTPQQAAAVAAGVGFLPLLGVGD